MARNLVPCYVRLRREVADPVERPVDRLARELLRVALVARRALEDPVLLRDEAFDPVLRELVLREPLERDRPVEVFPLLPPEVLREAVRLPVERDEERLADERAWLVRRAPRVCRADVVPRLSASWKNSSATSA